MTFLGSLLIALTVGGTLLGIILLAERYVQSYDREPKLDALDYDNARPDGWFPPVEDERQ